ncbi:unnamed protein product [Protopolystoma xenopodis]|uniref:Uncharacterized protein n=1 Tax=Protopolystoma xenopodis TaxID=117903 RepID=A0A3S4ZBE4_9PLAT|nr:unnamed protein product [Protopolystoma xenopodis]
MLCSSYPSSSQSVSETLWNTGLREHIASEINPFSLTESSLSQSEAPTIPVTTTPNYTTTRLSTLTSLSGEMNSLRDRSPASNISVDTSLNGQLEVAPANSPEQIQLEQRRNHSHRLCYYHHHQHHNRTTNLQDQSRTNYPFRPANLGQNHVSGNGLLLAVPQAGQLGQGSINLVDIARVLAAFGRIVVSTTYPGLCTAKLPDDLSVHLLAKAHMST